MEIKNVGKSFTNICINLIGTYFEFFDFMLFAFCIPIFIQTFSPPGLQKISLFLMWGTFAISYFVRPLGSFFFGFLGDLFGRNIALSFSTLLMSIPTIAIGLIPGYLSIGKWSLILLLCCRILQGFAVSGEYTGSIVNLYEITKKHRNLICSLTSTSCALGIFSGLLLLIIFRNSFSLRQHEYWWRGTFVIAGCLVGLSGLLLKFLTKKKTMKKKEHISIKEILKILSSEEKMTLCSVFLLTAFSSATSYIASTFLPNHMQNILGIDRGLKISTFCISPVIFATILSGFLSDKYGNKLIMFLAAIMTIILFPFLIFYLTNEGNFLRKIIILYACYSGLIGIFGGALCSYLVENFNCKTRYTGSSIAYNMAVCFVGPITPLLLTALWGKQLIINLAFAVISLLALFCIVMNSNTFK